MRFLGVSVINIFYSTQQSVLLASCQFHVVDVIARTDRKTDGITLTSLTKLRFLNARIPFSPGAIKFHTNIAVPADIDTGTATRAEVAGKDHSDPLVSHLGLDSTSLDQLTSLFPTHLLRYYLSGVFGIDDLRSLRKGTHLTVLEMINVRC